MRATRIIIEVKDSDGQWFRAFQMPFEGADEMLLPPDAAARLADTIQKHILAELAQSQQG